jgi:DnaJ-class molecular chaperone
MVNARPNCTVCEGEGEIYVGRLDRWGLPVLVECNHCYGAGLEPTYDYPEWTPR